MSRSPTGTLRIEKAWNIEINKRWAAFKKSSLGRLRQINEQSVIINKAEPFAMSAEQLRTYMVFLRAEIQRLLIVSEQAPNWQASYQLQSYERGLESTRAALISQGATLTPTASEISAGASLGVFTATPTLGASSGMAPIHQDALEFLYSRSYESLKGWTDKMAAETRQILFEGVKQGNGINELIREISTRQDVSRSRARVIAQTETIQAYQQSTTNETERAAEEIGEEVKLRWLTRLDGRVRHLHASWHGTVVTTAQNRVRIGQSPWNCRCGQVPVIEGADTEAKRIKFAKEREAILDAEREGQKEKA